MKSKSRKWLLGAGGGLLLLTGALYVVGRVLRGPDTVLPAFTEPAAGPRAPSSELFGFKVGVTTYPSARQRLGELGISCEDTSMRALMARLRESKRREIEEKKVRGEDPDTVTGASILHHRSKKERNPQVRLSCAGAPAKALGRDWLGDAAGRLLLVFDSPDHPLRHVSYSREHTSAAAALADYRSTGSAFARVLGPPADEASSKPRDATTLNDMARFERRSSDWKYSDLSAGVVILNYSRIGPNVTETVEVPWPVRSDAPAMPHGSGQVASR